MGKRWPLYVKDEALKFDKAKKIEIDGKSLDFSVVSEAAFSQPGEIYFQLSSASKKAMEVSNRFVRKVAKEKVVYGINTGFGALAGKKIDENDLEKLQLNLIRSHCAGVGKPFSRPIVRAMMLLRANCLALGNSGIAPEAVELLLDLINFGVTPLIPEKGSVGASGDLAPLGHMALALIGEGEVEFEGEIVKAALALERIGRQAFHPGPKDGLALINGTAAMSALGALAIVRAKNLFKIADIAAAMSLDGLQGTCSAYDVRISQLKPHQGQLRSSKNLLKLLEGSEILVNHKNCDRVQDPYSLRCVPQVHGACRQTLEHATGVFEVELNAVTDNPLVFPDDKAIISGGNFHGEALALAMDYLSMGLAELCNISERRIEKMMNPTFSHLPHFLSKNPGLNSGMMIAHVTAAALASENKYLCHPASVDSIPTSTDKEDHVSMGVTSGRKLSEVVENLQHILAIEILCSCQAIEFHRPLKSSPPIEALIKLIRKSVAPLKDDRTLHQEIKHIATLIDSGEILDIVTKTIGVLK